MNKTILLAADASAPFEPTADEPCSETYVAEQSNLSEACSPEHPAESSVPAELGLTTKECPHCHANAFSDMDTCFNCMYSFVDGTINDECEEEVITYTEGSELIDEQKKCAPKGAQCSQIRGEEQILLDSFLVEFHGFLGEFLLHRGIEIKKF